MDGLPWKNLIKLEDLGGTPIFGNIQLEHLFFFCFCFSQTSWGTFPSPFCKAPCFEDGSGAILFVFFGEKGCSVCSFFKTHQRMKEVDFSYFKNWKSVGICKNLEKKHLPHWILSRDHTWPTYKNWGRSQFGPYVHICQRYGLHGRKINTPPWLDPPSMEVGKSWWHRMMQPPM